ncbi:MAG: YkgJ family cysteine cluster protein [Aeromonas sp.]
MECRGDCGACCIAPSISSAIPGMPAGKPAGVACTQLDEARNCKIFGHADRPAVCGGFRPMLDVCGHHRTEAMWLIGELERLTA